MFNILRYQTDQVTGSLEIRVVFQQRENGNIIHDGGIFTTKQAGDSWLRNLKRDYFSFLVENYLVHKKHIIDYAIEAGPSHKSISAKKISLDLLFKYSRWAAFEKAPLMEMCKWAVQMENHFLAVLPSQKNNSYKSSLECATQIIKFAKEHSCGALLKKAS
jgi:hypothetical protein